MPDFPVRDAIAPTQVLQLFSIKSRNNRLESEDELVGTLKYRMIYDRDSGVALFFPRQMFILPSYTQVSKGGLSSDGRQQRFASFRAVTA
jgi:hypothetical protein